tara:strand:- start:564 stop:845 length:282 start_codon:yes stop_codon:yes gene_type:complete
MSTNLTKYDKEKQGKLWVNDNKETDKQPDFTGSVVLEGVKYSLAAWSNMTEGGKKYLGVRISEWQDKKGDNTVSMSMNEVADQFSKKDDSLPF